MIYKNLHNLFIIVILALSALHISCGDEARFTESDKQVLSEAIYVTPEKFNGAVHIFYSPLRKVFLNLNENVKFTAAISLNGTVLDADLATNYYRSILWEINGEKFNIPTFRYTFREPGEYAGHLQIVDTFGDTTLDTISIFVNTPTHIHLNNPRDKYNQANAAFNDTLELKWEIQGLDPWENTVCTVYGSTEKSNLWKMPLGEADCNESVSLIGNTYEGIVNDLPSDYSETYYWGVILNVSTDNNISETDTSEIFSFSTKIFDSKKSVLHIPIIYDKMSTFDNPETIITVTDQKGDTVAQTFSYLKEDYVTMHIEPQTNVTVHLESRIQPEFKAKDFTVNITEQSDIVADTVIFTDNIAPTIWPISNTKSVSSNFKFVVLDIGSGVNSSKIRIYKNGLDEIDGAFNDTLLTIPNIRDSSYTLTIIAYDKAGNVSTPVYWKVETQTQMNEDEEEEIIQVLSGPFSNRKELE